MDNEKHIRNYILPLFEASKSGDDYSFEKFHGTCFLLGSEGFALTNKHLAGIETENILCVMTVKDNVWSVFEVSDKELHPSENVAILKLRGINSASFLKVSPSSEHSSFKYMQWSYPEEVVQELAGNGKVQNRPDLVFLEGYIRRRISGMPIPGIEGNAYYELSEPGTVGCSGSPVIERQGGEYWKVVGIYVGNRRTSVDNGYSAVGYAIRSDAIHDWSPVILGRKITEI